MLSFGFYDHRILPFVLLENGYYVAWKIIGSGFNFHVAWKCCQIIGYHRILLVFFETCCRSVDREFAVPSPKGFNTRIYTVISIQVNAFIYNLYNRLTFCRLPTNQVLTLCNFMQLPQYEKKHVPQEQPLVTCSCIGFASWRDFLLRCWNWLITRANEFLNVKGTGIFWDQ